MKSVWYNPWFSITILILFNIGLIVNYYVPYGNEILYFNPWRIEPLNALFRFLTHLGEAWAYAFFALLLLLVGRYRYALLIVVAGLTTLPVQWYLKDIIGTDRPLTYFEKLGRIEEVTRIPGVVLNSGQTSFPSGHTIGAFALYTVLAMIFAERRPRFGILFALLGASVGISRIFLFQHFLADVMFGALLGILVGEVVGWLSRAPAFRRMTWLNGNLLHRPLPDKRR